MFEITDLKKKKKELNSRLISLKVGDWNYDRELEINGCISCWNNGCEGSCNNTCTGGCGGCGKS